MDNKDNNIEVKFDSKKLETALQIMPGKIFTALKGAFREVGDTFLATMVNERLSGHSATSLGVRTGDLRRSFKKAVSGDNINDLTMFVFTTSKYAQIHETGGTIYPKNTKYLAIPLTAAMTSSGVSRYKSPRDIALVYGGRSKAGNIILRTPGMKGKAGIPMFVLVKSVTIPARLNMMATWGRDIPVTMGILNNAVDKTLKNN